MGEFFVACSICQLFVAFANFPSWPTIMMILDAEMSIITAHELVQVTSSTPLVLTPFFPVQAFGVNSTENI